MFGNNIDNSRFTPEFNNGQVNGNQQTNNSANSTQANAQVNAQVNAQANAQINTQPNGNIDNSNNVTNNNPDVTPNNDTNQDDNGGQDTITVNGVEYSSVEDVVAALNDAQERYKNLQRDYTKKSQKLSLMNKQNNSPINMQYGQPFGYVNPNGFQQQMPQYGNTGMGLNNLNQIQDNQMAIQRQRQMMQQVNNQVAMNQAMIQMAADNAVVDLKQQNPDFDEVAGTLWDLIDTDDYFSNIQFTSPEMVKQTINIAYNMAKQKVEQAKMNIKVNNARKEAYNNKKNKLINNDNSQGANPNSSRQKQETPQDHIKSSILGVKPIRF